MAETENEKVSKKSDVAQNDEKRKFTLLVAFACFLSLGSLAYSTWSFLDLNKVDAVPIEQLGNLSLVGLSAAAAMDVFWSATMVAEYRGQRIMWTGWKAQSQPRNILPLIGWLEAIAVAAMLGYHGHQLGGWTAAFTAILPLVTKFTWTLALSDLRDPTELTFEEKEALAAERREARRLKEKTLANQDRHEAELIAVRREGEKALEKQRLAGELAMEEKRNKFELKKMDLETENDLKALDGRMKAQLRMSLLRSQQEVVAMQDEFAFEQSLRRPPQTIVGHTVPRRSLSGQSTLEITDGTFDQGMDEVETPDLAAHGLTKKEQERAELARGYYAVNAEHGGTVTKAAFAKANQVHPPRVTEVTKEFPIEWFVERNLATWLERQN